MIGVKKYVKKTGVTDDIITLEKAEYYSHTLSEVVDGKNRNEWVLITRSRNGK